jgi:WD40 repeat protein
MPYDAFISYKHDAPGHPIDSRLAAAVQAGLHRFAKPWHRRRALNVFRDTTDLAASPDLWPSVERALADSRYLILLACPEAATSPWVDRELKAWLALKQADAARRMLVVLTGGTIAWDRSAGCCDWGNTSALPSCLREVLRDEPRYVNLCSAKVGDTCSLDDEGFRDAIADLAAPLHGKPKQAMIGEDLRQHKKTIRVARAAAAVMLLLAVGLGIVSLEARRLFWTSESRRLAARATELANDRLDLSLLLSLEANRIRKTTEAQDALLRGLLAAPYLREFVHYGDRQRKAALDVSPDGKTLAWAEEGAADVVLWTPGTPEPEGPTLKGEGGSVQRLAFSQDGKLLAVAGDKGLVTIWDVKTRKQLPERHRIGDGGSAEVLGKYVTALEFGSGNEVAAYHGGQIVLWDGDTGDERRRWSVGKGLILALALRPDGEALAVASLAMGAGGEGSGAITVWDLTQPQPVPHGLPGVPGFTLSLAYSPDGRRLASGHQGQVRLWDLDQHGLSDEEGHVLPGHWGESPVLRVAFSPDGSQLACGGLDAQVMLWRLAAPGARGEPAKVMAGPLGGYDQPVYVVRYGPDKDSRDLWLGYADGTVASWGVGKALRLGDRLPLPPGFSRFTAVSFRPADGKRSESQTLVAAGRSAVASWDTGTRVQLGDATDLGDAALAPQQSMVTVSAFRRDGAQLALGNIDGAVVLWDVSRQKRVVARIQGPDPRSPVTGLALSDDGKTLASLHFDRSLTVWDLSGSQPRESFRQRRAPSWHAPIALSRDGRMLAIGNGSGIQLWDTRTRRRLGKALSAYKEPVRCLAFSPDGRTLASGNTDGTVITWNARTKRRSGAPLEYHMGAVLSVAFSRDGKRLASGDSSGIAVWDVGRADRRELLTVLPVNGSPWSLSLSLSEHGDTVAWADGTGGPVLARVNPDLAPRSRVDRARKVLNGHRLSPGGRAHFKIR